MEGKGTQRWIKQRKGFIFQDNTETTDPISKNSKETGNLDNGLVFG